MTSATLHLIFLIAGGVLLFGTLIGALLAWRSEGRLAVIVNTPRSTAQELLTTQQAGGARGQVCEVAGEIMCDTPLYAPLSEQPCVAYSHTLHWEEWGKPSMLDRRATTHSLVYKHGGSEQQDRCVQVFWVRDASGSVLIDPAMAELDLRDTDSRYDVMTASVGGTERRTRREERALPLGPVYVLGYLGERNGQPIIQHHPSEPHQKFLISYRDEQALIGSSSRHATAAYVLAGVSGILGMALVALGML